MSSSRNKLNLREYLNKDRESQVNQNSESSKVPKNKKSIKLNTLPCEQLSKSGEEEQFLFRSTWQDIEECGKQFKGIGCQSPTFASQMLSQANQQNHSYTSQSYREEQKKGLKVRQPKQLSRSRSKNKSFNQQQQMYISDRSHSKKHKQTTSVLINHENGPFQVQLNQLEESRLNISHLQFQNQEILRQNEKLKEKNSHLKVQNQRLTGEVEKKSGNNRKKQVQLMSNEQLFEKMKEESFWKFYLKAQKLLKQSGTDEKIQPINFLKELQALREVSSEMKKEIKNLKSQRFSFQEQNQTLKDKVSILETQLEQMRLKCIVYESSLKKLKEQNSKLKIQVQKASVMEELQEQLRKSQKQFSKKSEAYNQLKILYEECEKERVNGKKKLKAQQDQLYGLKTEVQGLKTQISHLEVERQELTANKKELIEKQRLKEKIYNLEKELKQALQIKASEGTQKEEILKKLQDKQVKIKQMQRKLEQFSGKISKTQEQKSSLQKLLLDYEQKLRQVQKQLIERKQQFQQKLIGLTEQKGAKLVQISEQMQKLTYKLQQQQKSITQQRETIQKLQQINNKKEEQLKLKHYESQKLKQSLILIKQQSQKQKEQALQECSGQSQCAESYRHQLESFRQYTIRLEEKHNEALQLYEQVYNEKVDLEMQLEVLNKEYLQVQQQGHSTKDLYKEIIRSLLTIKQEIIKKILIFCPVQSKKLIVDYIYYGDILEKKYLMVYGLGEQNVCKGNNFNDDDCEQQEDSEGYYDQPSSSTVRNNTRYNQHFPQKQHCNRNYNYNQKQSEFRVEAKFEQNEQIYSLLEKFVQIGKQIEQHFTNKASNSLKTFSNSNKNYIKSVNIPQPRKLRQQSYLMMQKQNKYPSNKYPQEKISNRTKTFNSIEKTRPSRHYKNIQITPNNHNSRNLNAKPLNEIILNRQSQFNQNTGLNLAQMMEKLRYC